MDEQPEYLKLAADADISPSYANEILSGKRTPSRSLAISIYRRTGRRFSPIAELTEAEIDLLERLEPAKDQAA